MKSIISGVVIATAVVACLTLNVHAKSVRPMSTVAVSDTGKMAKGKMKMDKKMAKKDTKMAKEKMKMAKDSSKMKMEMAKDTSHKM